MFHGTRRHGRITGPRHRGTVGIDTDQPAPLQRSAPQTGIAKIRQQASKPTRSCTVRKRGLLIRESRVEPGAALPPAAASQSHGLDICRPVGSRVDESLTASMHGVSWLQTPLTMQQRARSLGRSAAYRNNTAGRLLRARPHRPTNADRVDVGIKTTDWSGASSSTCATGSHAGGTVERPSA